MDVAVLTQLAKPAPRSENWSRCYPSFKRDSNIVDNYIIPISARVTIMKFAQPTRRSLVVLLLLLVVLCVMLTSFGCEARKRPPRPMGTLRAAYSAGPLSFGNKVLANDESYPVDLHSESSIFEPAYEYVQFLNLFGEEDDDTDEEEGYDNTLEEIFYLGESYDDDGEEFDDAEMSDDETTENFVRTVKRVATKLMLGPRIRYMPLF